MINTTTLKYAATALGAFAILAVAPATAFATDNAPGTGGGGCHYTDADGYDVPIDEGQDVFVDGKIVSCRGGSIVVTTAPKTGAAGVPQHQAGGVLSPVNETPKKSPVVRTVPILTAKN
jgi:hypothetical protein